MYDVIKLKDREIIRMYKEELREGITENYAQQNNKKDGTSESKWENTERVVTAVANEVGGYAERRKRTDWYDEECQIQVEGRFKAPIEMLMTGTRKKITKIS